MTSDFSSDFTGGDLDYRALRLFARHTMRELDGENPSFDELLRAHPELESRLRKLAELRSGTKADAPRVRPGELERLREGRGSSRYVLLGEIARGGMGVVLHVWDTLLRRPLAMKLIDPTSAPEGSEDATRATARFLEEAQVAGRLEHPGVIPIHDLGVDESGRVYFTMPLIEGRDGNEVFDLARARSEGWSLTRALLVLAKVCDVVAYAHSRGVIHRDLKAANVMVGKFGETFVVDWGLAKVLGTPELREVPERNEASGEPREDPPASADRTVDGTVFGTPSYMAPEQAEGRVADVSTHTDVYALGAMLYRLLAGRSPYSPRRGKDDAAKTLELVRRGPPTPLGRIAPEAPPELVAICEKAMARRVEDRYESAEALAENLHAFLEGRVVSAYEGGFLAEAKKLVLRNRALAAMFALILLTALAAILEVSWVSARGRRRLENKNEELSTARVEALESARRAVLSSYAAHVTAASASLRAGDVADAKQRLDRCPADLRGWEWAHLELGTDGSLLRCRLEDESGRAVGGAPSCIARGPTAATVFAGYPDGSIREWDVEEGTLRRTIEPGSESDVGGVLALALGSDGRVLASASAGGRVLLHDLEGASTPRVVGEREGALVALAFDSQAARIASCAQDGSVRIRDLDGIARELGRVESPSSVCFAAAGTRVVCAGGDGVLHVFDPQSGGEIAKLRGHRAGVRALASDATGERVASGSDDGTLRVWNLERAELLEVLSDGGRPVTAVAFPPSGTSIASGDTAGGVRLWDLSQPARPLSFTGHDAGIRAIVFDGSGARIVSSAWDRALRVWDVRGPAHVSAYRASDTPFRCGAFASDGARVLLGSSDGVVVLYDSLRGRLERSWTVPVAITAVRFLPGDERIAAAGVDGTIYAWELATSGDEPRTLSGHTGAVHALATVGETLLSASDDGTVRAWDPSTDANLAVRAEHSGPVLAMDASPHGTSFASSSADHTVRVWPAIGEPPVVLPAGESAVRAVALHPGGDLVAWADDAGRLALVPVSGGDPEWSEWCEEPVASLAWSPDGERLACGTVSGEIQVRNFADGERLLVAREHTGEVCTVAFDPRGERLLGISAEGGLRILESTPVPARSRARMAGGPSAESEVAVLAQRMTHASWAVLVDPDESAERYQSALECVREASRLVPGDPAIRVRLGAALVRTGDAAGAAELLERAIDEVGDGDRAWARAFLGLAYCRLGRTANAGAMRDALQESRVTAPEPDTAALLAELERCIEEAP